MGIFKKRKIKQTEFVQDPEAFIQFLRKDDPDAIAFGIGTLVAAGKDSMPAMIKILLDEDEESTIRDRAGQVLSQIGEPAIFPLLAILENLDLSSQTSAVNLGKIAAVLGGMGEEVISPLILSLDSTSKAVKFAAAIALVQTGKVKAIQAVREAAEKGDSAYWAILNQDLGK